MTRFDPHSRGPSDSDGPPVATPTAAPSRFEETPRLGTLWVFTLALVIVSVATDLAVWQALPDLSRADFVTFAVVRYALPAFIVLLAALAAHAIGRRIRARYGGSDQG
ncbi:MAG: hypothetical protein KF911_05580 [Pseudomonadales bacterium]|nr:hypothetical protein [Pseudomonadales bacterium]